MNVTLYNSKLRALVCFDFKARFKAQSLSLARFPNIENSEACRTTYHRPDAFSCNL